MDGGVLLVHIIAQFRDLLGHVQNLEMGCNKLEMGWITSRLTIGPIGDGFIGIVDGAVRYWQI